MAKKIFSLLLGCVMCMSVAVLVQSPAGVLADEPETLEEARERQRQVERQQLEALAEIDVVEAEAEEISDAYNAGAILVDRQENKVEAARQQLRLAQAEYEATQNNLAESETMLASYREQITEIAVEAYLAIQVNQDAILLSTADLNEGVKRKATIDFLSTSTADFLDELRLLEDENRLLYGLADVALAKIQATDQALNEELDVLEADQRRLSVLESELEKKRAQLEADVATFEQESEDLTRFILEEEARERARQLAGSDEYVWPGAGRVGSGFGLRFHPILKYYRPHNGIDMSGKTGDPIWAAHKGVVIKADYGRGFGNYVVLDHGDGTSSIYAHMSRFSVRKDQIVAAGDQVGLVGSTGLATGPHLHFEIRLEGKPVDPLDYLPPRN